MQCPYCQTSLKEDAAKCPKCELTLDKLSQFMGPVPSLHAGINDGQSLFSKRGHSQVLNAISDVQSEFPQMRFHIVSRVLKVNFPVEAQLFWLMNRASLNSENARSGKNFDILLGIDSESKQVGLIIGYGLESYLNPETLESILSSANLYFEKSHYDQAVIAIIHTLSETLRHAHSQLAKTENLEIHDSMQESY